VCEGEADVSSWQVHGGRHVVESPPRVRWFQVPGFWVSRNQRKPVETRKLFGNFPDEERKQEVNVGGRVMVLLIWIK